MKQTYQPTPELDAIFELGRPASTLAHLQLGSKIMAHYMPALQEGYSQVFALNFMIQYYLDHKNLKRLKNDPLTDDVYAKVKNIPASLIKLPNFFYFDAQEELDKVIFDRFIDEDSIYFRDMSLVNFKKNSLGCVEILLQSDIKEDGDKNILLEYRAFTSLNKQRHKMVEILKDHYGEFKTLEKSFNQSEGKYLLKERSLFDKIISGIIRLKTFIKKGDDLSLEMGMLIKINESFAKQECLYTHRIKYYLMLLIVSEINARIKKDECSIFCCFNSRSLGLFSRKVLGPILDDVDAHQAKIVKNLSASTLLK